MRARRKPDKQDACVRVAKGRDGFSPILHVEVGASLFACNACAVFAQFGAALARNHAALDRLEGAGTASH